MTKTYSRFSHNEERRNIQKAVWFLVLTVATLLLLFFFGIPLVAKFAGFLSDIGKGSSPIEITDTTPPAPPQLENLPEATKDKVLTLNGKSESGATVFIFFNDSEEEIVADEEGVFTTKLSLKKGDNTIVVQASDKAGNQGQKTQEFKIVFDDEKPKLEVSSPTDGAEFFGSNKNITITGTTDAEASITINDRFVNVNDDGSFTFSASLSDGENSFNIKSFDKAGNLTEKTIKFKYSS